MAKSNLAIASSNNNPRVDTAALAVDAPNEGTPAQAVETLPPVDSWKAEEAPVAVFSEPAAEAPTEPVAATKKASEKHHPFTVQIRPSVWKRAKLLASLEGTTISELVEQHLARRVSTDLKSLIAQLDGGVED